MRQSSGDSHNNYHVPGCCCQHEWEGILIKKVADHLVIWDPLAAD